MQGMYNVVAQTMLALQEAIVAILDGLNERFNFNTGDLANRLMGDSKLSIQNGVPKLIQTGIIGLRASLKETNLVFDKFPNKMEEALNTALTSLTNIFNKPLAKPAQAIENAVNKLETVINNRNSVDAANAEARKREIQRIDKPLGRFGGNNPILSGSLGKPSILTPLDEINKQIESTKKRRAQLIIDNFIDPNDPFGGLGRAGRQAGISSASKDLRDLIAKRKELLRSQGGAFGAQQIQLADIVASTTGSFKATRNNLGKFNGKSIDQQQLAALETVATNTGGAQASLDEILQKSGGLLFK